jgi:hypothetical protein
VAPAKGSTGQAGGAKAADIKPGSPMRVSEAVGCMVALDFEVKCELSGWAQYIIHKRPDCMHKAVKFYSTRLDCKHGCNLYVQRYLQQDGLQDRQHVGECNLYTLH